MVCVRVQWCAECVCVCVSKQACVRAYCVFVRECVCLTMHSTFDRGDDPKETTRCQQNLLVDSQ